MPVADILETVFINYVDKSLYELLSENQSDVSKFQKNLRGRSFEVRGEVARDIKEKLINPSNYISVFSNAVGKIERLKKDRFYKEKDNICYHFDKLDLVIDQFGPELHQFAYYIFDYCQDLYTFLNKQEQEYKELLNINSSNSIDHLIRRIKKNRIPSRQSFQLINTGANLNLVHKILRDKEFIDKSVSYNNFSMVFSGDPVSPKVIWENANALHYFIQEIIEGKGVKNPNEGKWKRTIKCFKKPNGEYKVTDLKDTKPPASSKTNMLDLAIEEINGVK
jgi:hypothetical protein